jgi:hypothetical protein
MNTGGVHGSSEFRSSKWNWLMRPLSNTQASPSRMSVRGLQRRDHLGELAEAGGMVDGLTADEPHAPAILERQHAPAVVLLFVDPAGR